MEQTSQNIELLSRAFASLKNREEIAAFLKDIMTLAELENLTERLNIAEMLEKGIPYREIASTTQTSTATVTRVAHWYHHGNGGYQLVLDRFKE